MTRTWPSLLICLLVTAIGWLAFSQETDLTGAINELADRLAFANVGYVRSISGDTVYIDLGQDSGISEGMRFEVVRLGEPIVSGGVIIGHQEEIIGEIAITRVREQMSLASIINKSKEIVEGDKVYQLTKQIERIAITEFPYGERFNNLSKDIEDRFYTAMIQRGVQIVERERLTEILAEQAMEWTGLFDLSSAAELGKLLGVEGVLIGSLTDQGETLAIRARLVDVGTAQAITAAAVSINKIPAVITALNSGVRPKPSVIPPEEPLVEVPEGSFLFSDEFEAFPDERWGTTDGNWTVINGRFTPLDVESDTDYPAWINIGQLTNYAIEVDVYMGRAYRPYYDYVCWAGVTARMPVSGGYAVTFWLKGKNYKMIGTRLRTIDYIVDEKTFDAKSPIHVRIEVRGRLYTAYVNGKKISEFSDSTYQGEEATKVGLRAWYDDVKATARTTFDNFRIAELP